jgi:predicted ATP-grasp superfamily ATP-dependent carboligase
MNEFKEHLRTGAIVLGGDYQGLGIVRSLGQQGIPVFVVDDEYSISRFSRYRTKSFRVADLRNEKVVVEMLLSLAQRYDLKGWVLFPTRDELVATLSQHKQVLSEWFRVPTPCWATIQWTWDKRNTYRLATSLGIPAPKTWIPQSLDELDQIECGFPVAIKPAIKEHFFYATKAKAWRADSRNELRELFTRASKLAGLGEVLVQDLIPGDGARQFSYCAFFKDKRPIGKMLVRRRRQHPHEFGRASTYVETTTIPKLEALSESFLSSINYYGLVEVEFKEDPRDGELKLLDVNARTWGYHSLGPKAGVDFPYLLYRDQMGEGLEPVCGRSGMSWVRLVTDVPTGLLDILQGRLKLRDYVGSVRKADDFAVPCWNDPLPGIMEFLLLPYLFIRRGF